jgi:hypothetical protein
MIEAVISRTAMENVLSLTYIQETDTQADYLAEASEKN